MTDAVLPRPGFFSESQRTPWSKLALWFFLTRAAVWIVAGVALWLVPPGPFDVHKKQVEWLNHWDAGWYLSIARDGYFYAPDAKSNAAFFPLYPMLARGLGGITGNILVAGYLLSGAFLFGSCALLWKLVVRDYGSRALADTAVLFLLLCPLTVFYSSFYTESLFLFLALSVAWLAGDAKWLPAGLCGFLAALTRPPGALLAIVIAVEFAARRLRQKDKPKKVGPLRPSEVISFLIALLLPPSALVLFNYYLWTRFHDGRIMLHVHAQWHQHMIAPWQIFQSGLIYHAFDTIWLYAALVTGLSLAALAVRYRLRAGHLAMLFTFLLLYCTNSLLEALPRYLSVLFPFYIVAAEICARHPRWKPVLLSTSGALAILSVVLFVDGYWFT